MITVTKSIGSPFSESPLILREVESHGTIYYEIENIVNVDKKIKEFEDSGKTYQVISPEHLKKLNPRLYFLLRWYRCIKDDIDTRKPIMIHKKWIEEIIEVIKETVYERLERKDFC